MIPEPIDGNKAIDFAYAEYVAILTIIQIVRFVRVIPDGRGNQKKGIKRLLFLKDVLGLMIESYLNLADEVDEQLHDVLGSFVLIETIPRTSLQQSY